MVKAESLEGKLEERGKKKKGGHYYEILSRHREEADAPPREQMGGCV